MKIQFGPEFIKTLKKTNVRIRKKFKERIVLFVKNPYHPLLNNHPLKSEYYGFRSINITADWRAIYKEITEDYEESVAFFVAIGTHVQLYRKKLS